MEEVRWPEGELNHGDKKMHSRWKDIKTEKNPVNVLFLSNFWNMSQ